MLWLLKILFFGHVHKWVNTTGVSRWERHDAYGRVISNGPRYVCHCEKCGAYKAFDL